MEVTYKAGGLVKVTHDGIDYELKDAYQLIQLRISHFNKFGVIDPQDVKYAAVLLTLEQHCLDYQRTPNDKEVIDKVWQALPK